MLLVAHAPQTSAKLYTPPRQVTSGMAEPQYAVVPLRRGWGVAFVDGDSHVEFQRFSPTGSMIGSVRLDADASPKGMVSAAALGSTIFTAWVSVRGQTSDLVGRWLTGERLGPEIVLAHPEGQVGTPDVFTTGSGFRVAYTVGVNGGSGLRLAALNIHSGRRTWVARVPSVGTYPLFPHVVPVADGSDLMVYMDMCCHPKEWEIRSAVLTADGRTIERRRLTLVPDLTNPGTGAIIIPAQWGLDLERGSKRVWGAWEAESQVYLGEWTDGGRFIGSSDVIPAGIDSSSPSVAVAPFGGGGLVLAGAQTGTQSMIFGARFGGLTVVSGERVEYESGGTISMPYGRQFGDAVRVFWQYQPNDAENARAMTATYGQVQSQSPTARLGLAPGDPWFDIVFLLVASAMAAAGLTLINVIVLAPLTASWFVLARLPGERWKWGAFITIVGAGLLVVFGVNTWASRWALIIQPQGGLAGVVVVVGGAFCGVLLSRWLLRDADAVFRAVGIAVPAMYFIAFMWALVKVQAALGPP
jgi:hypothetical protein